MTDATGAGKMRMPTTRRGKPRSSLALLAALAVAGCSSAPSAPSPSVDPCAVSALEDPSTPFGSGERRLSPPEARPLPAEPREVAGDGPRARISTGVGDIVVELFPGSAPVATENFVRLAEADYYDGVVFHRVVPGFVIQGGDGEWGRIDRLCEALVGQGGPGYTIPDEPFAGEYRRGTVAMARTAQPNSQGSQFFIVLDDAAEPALEAYRTYVIFGRVVEGMEVVDAIAAMPTSDERPLQAVAVTDVKIERP